MAKERNRQRTKLFSIRLNAAEWSAVQQRADADRLSVAGVFRKAVFKLPRDKLPVQSLHPAPTPERAELAKITAQLGKTGSNLNQLARIANLGGWPEHEELAAACAEVLAACHALFQALGIERPPTPERAELEKITAQLGKTGNNLNQLARIAKLGSWPEHKELAAACADIRTMRDALFQALGIKRPPKAEPAP